MFSRIVLQVVLDYSRGKCSRLVLALGSPLGKCYVVQAELDALLVGLRIAQERGWYDLWVNMDSLSVVHCLSSDFMGPWKYCY